MNLEIKKIYIDDASENDLGPDEQNFNVLVRAEIGDHGKEGSEGFYFVATSPSGLEREVSKSEFKILRGYILMSTFDIHVIRRSIENIINHARSRSTWDEVIAFFNRYGVYDSEDLDGQHLP